MVTNKVLLGAAIGALTTIIVWAMHQFAKVDIPPEIALAGQTIMVFVGQYLIPITQDQIDKQQQNLNESAAKT